VHASRQLSERVEEVFAPLGILARCDALRVQDDQQVFLKIFVIGLAGIVAAESLDPGAINRLLVDLLLLIVLSFFIL